MEWSPQQVAALDKVGAWLNNPKKLYFQLAGFAGTGKTTLAKHLVASVQGDVYFAAYTGKAAHVLASAGAENVSTIHKLIYTPKDKSKKRLEALMDEFNQTPLDKADRRLELKNLIAAEEENLSRPSYQLNMESPLLTAALLVVDEYSMISEDMGRDLMSFGCLVLALGDPAQLPPIMGKCFFDDKPDVLLTEIHRQAADNPIIYLASQVRQGKPLQAGFYGDSRVVHKADILQTDLRDLALGADQILVGKNKTRAAINRRIRSLREYGNPLPVGGDKLVCLRNNAEFALLNGQIWECVDASEEVEDCVVLTIRNDEREQEVVAHASYFYGNKPDPWERGNAEEFDYGYALTVHKAQGSQWDSVLLFDEWRSQNRKEWLYTAITRAAHSITVIQQ